MPAIPSFAVDLGETYLTVDEIWPDGDAPEQPTAADVVEQMRRCCGSSPSAVVHEWALLDGLEVYGNHDGSKATL